MAGLEVEHRRLHAARGGLIGALSGVAMGVWMASQVPDREDPALMAIVFGSGGAAIGGILGALIGSTSHVVAWRPVPVNSLRHAAPPGDD